VERDHPIKDQSIFDKSRVGGGNDQVHYRGFISICVLKIKT
jgi:hypothetical protein